MLSDLRLAVRQLAKAPGFTLVAVLILALGIGTAAAIASVIDAVLVRPLGYDQPGQLAYVFETTQTGAPNLDVSPGVFTDWQTQGTLFEGFAAFQGITMNLTGAGEPVASRGMLLSADGLSLLRAHPVLGRSFASDEDQAGKSKVVVLTESLWRSRFGGRSDVIGRAVSLDNQTYAVIGVLPAGFLLPVENARFVVPYVITPFMRQSRGGHYFQVFARLKAGVTVYQGRAELAAIAQRQKPLYPPAWRSWSASLVSLDEHMTGPIRPSLLILSCAVGMLFLIACANFANLLLTRAAARQSEVAVRAALGAGRGRIVRQMLAESGLVSLLGGLVGAAAAWGCLGAIRSVAGSIGFHRPGEIRLDPALLGWTLAAALLTGIVFGLVPALRGSQPDLSRALKEGTRGSASEGLRLRSTLIVAEVGLSLVLLVGAGLLLRSFLLLSDVRPGFDAQRALTLQLSLPRTRYADNSKRAAFYERVCKQVEALPGVTAAGFADYLPLTKYRSDRFFRIPGWSGDRDTGFDVDLSPCTPNYFKAAGIALRRGRYFTAGDLAQNHHVAIINEAMVRACFADRDPLGCVLREAGDWVIVGVVADTRSRGLSEPAPPTVFLPQGLEPWVDATLVVRTQGNPLAVAEPIRKIILGLDPDQPVTNVRSLAGVVADSLAQRQLTLSLLEFFAISALLLSGIGLYGVIAYSVGQRTREFGIRSALGANAGNLLGLVLRQGLVLAGLGLVVGVAAALGLSRLLAGFLFGIRPADPLTFVAVSLALLLVALAASLLPARRAANVDPLVALRAE